ncbi:MAG: RNA 2',3'-cyclic phosphodiesterase [Pseudonocardiaceae bacterium]|nr:RNA 2',3'-cyclic phosphodiesterase [Pseudonocardiaceae bacterium]
MRLFVALTPPGDVIEELQARVAALREFECDVRWSRPEQWHLTLAFLGEVGDETRDELCRRLGRAAQRHPPLSLSFGGGGRFGHRVLWTRVHGDRDGLRRLADSVRAAVRRSGLPTEQRPYRPHLTLGRATTKDADLRPPADALASYEGRSWTVTELHLVRSRLGAGPDGTALHEAIASWPLRAR